MRVRGTAGERVSYESDESSDLKIKYYKEEARDYLRKRACYVLFKRREDSMQGLSTMGDNNEELLNAIKDVVLGDFEIEGDNAWKHFPEHGIKNSDIEPLAEPASSSQKAARYDIKSIAETRLKELINIKPEDYKAIIEYLGMNDDLLVRQITNIRM